MLSWAVDSTYIFCLEFYFIVHIRPPKSLSCVCQPGNFLRAYVRVAIAVCVFRFNCIFCLILIFLYFHLSILLPIFSLVYSSKRQLYIIILGEIRLGSSRNLSNSGYRIFLKNQWPHLAVYYRIRSKSAYVILSLVIIGYDRTLIIGSKRKRSVWLELRSGSDYRFAIKHALVTVNHRSTGLRCIGRPVRPVEIVGRYDVLRCTITVAFLQVRGAMWW